MTRKSLQFNGTNHGTLTRSFDRTFLEELNRFVTDSLSDLLWTPSIDADQNQEREGVFGKVERVGNIMIDSLEMMRGRIEENNKFKEFSLTQSKF